MKKILNLILCVLLAFAAVSMSSCSSGGGDDPVIEDEGDNSQLIGRWYHVKDVFSDGDVDKCGDPKCYWEFTSTKVTVHDVMDIANNKPTPYKLEGNRLSFSGYGMYTVKTLNASELVLFIDAGYMTQTIYFRR